MVQHFKSLCAVAVVAAASLAASSAKAAIFNYADIQGDCFTITNITESSVLTTTVNGVTTVTQPTSGVYGQPFINEEGCIQFITDGYGVSADATNGPAISKTLYGKLSFVVTFEEAQVPSVVVNEFGLLGGFKGGTSFVNFGLFLKPVSGPGIIDFDSGVTSPSFPWSTLSPTIETKAWTLEAGGDGEKTYKSFLVVIDNDLTASAPVGGFASIDKKGLEICIDCDGGGDIPEPASLGVLGLGAAGLLLRRRK